MNWCISEIFEIILYFATHHHWDKNLGLFFVLRSSLIKSGTWVWECDLAAISTLLDLLSVPNCPHTLSLHHSPVASLPHGLLHSQSKAVIYNMNKYFLEGKANWESILSQGERAGLGLEIGLMNCGDVVIVENWLSRSGLSTNDHFRVTQL